MFAPLTPSNVAKVVVYLVVSRVEPDTGLAAVIIGSTFSSIIVSAYCVIAVTPPTFVVDVKFNTKVLNSEVVPKNTLL